MQDYETRIFSHTGTLSLVAVVSHFSDFAAIRAAQKMCNEGETAEVWREDDCIYNEPPRQPLGLVWPIRAGKASG